MDVWTKFEEGR